GRSLGVHLLLASQRLEEGRLRGLDSHLSYRIGLRTFSASESRAVLGVPDAYELPPVPGSAFLKFDTGTLVRFKAAFVSGPLPRLAEPPSLDQLLPALAAGPARGYGPAGWVGNGRLTVPVALVDKPFEQRRDLLWADLSGAAGHAVVVGAPQSGKSTLLRTLV